MAVAGAIIAAVAAVAGSVISYTGQRRAAKKVAAAERESRAIQQANSRIEQARNRRRAIRERRIMAARIEQSAINSGVSGSSGEAGAVSVMGTNLGDVLSIDSSRMLTAQGISRQQQIASDAIRRGNAQAALGQLISSVGKAVGGAMMGVAAGGGWDNLFGAGAAAASQSGSTASKV